MALENLKKLVRGAKIVVKVGIEVAKDNTINFMDALTVGAAAPSLISTLGGIQLSALPGEAKSLFTKAGSVELLRYVASEIESA